MKKYINIILALSIIGCAAPGPVYNPIALATQLGATQKYGAINFASKCSFTYVQFGVTDGNFQNGYCIDYEAVFIFRVVDTNEMSLGKSTAIPHKSIKSVSISKASLINMKQFQFRTDSGVGAMIFRPDAGLGYMNERNEELLNFFITKNFKVLADTEIVKYAVTPSDGTNVIIVQTQKKK